MDLAVEKVMEGFHKGNRGEQGVEVLLVELSFSLLSVAVRCCTPRMRPRTRCAPPCRSLTWGAGWAGWVVWAGLEGGRSMTGNPS